jgi:hypothetical protein
MGGVFPLKQQFFGGNVMKNIVKAFHKVSVFASLALAGSVVSACSRAGGGSAEEGSETEAIVTTDPVIAPLYKKYKALPYLNAGFYGHEWEDYAKCLPKSARTIFNDVANAGGLNKYDLFTVAMGEGMGWYFDRAQSEKDLVEAPVDGYVYLGVDFFVDELPLFLKEGYLPSSFVKNSAFTTHIVTRDEPGDHGVPIKIEVPTFTNFKASMQAIAAYYGRRLKMATNLASRSGFGTLSADEKSFWAYYFYQNPQLARSSMLSNGKKVFGTKPDSSRPKDIRSKSLKRVVTARYFEGYKMLEDSAKCNGAAFNFQ